MPTPRQLANLRPARLGEIRNPRGRNQWTADRERRERFQAICRALNRCKDPGLESTLVESVVRQICDGALAGDPRLLCQLWDYLMPLPEGHAKRYNRGPGRAGGPDAAGLRVHSIFGRTTLAEIGVQNLPRLPPFRQLPTPLPYTLAPPAPGRFGRGRRWLQRARAPSKPASPDFRHATGRQFMVKLSPARSRWPS